MRKTGRAGNFYKGKNENLKGISVKALYAI